VNKKEKAAVVDYLESLINALESNISIGQALELAMTAAPKEIRDKVEEVYRINRTGRTLYESFIVAGFPKDFFFLLQPFEEEGNVVEGLRAVKELLEIDVKIESSLSQIDTYFLILILIVLATLLIMAGYYAPTMGNLLKEAIPNPQDMSNLAKKLVEYRDYNIKKALTSPWFIGLSVSSLLLWKTRAYRKFLTLLPSYRKMLKLADKTAITTAMALSRNYRQTVKALAESFGNRYRFKEIEERFNLGVGFNAFETSDLFDNEEEKKLFILAGNNNFSDLFVYLKKRYNAEREKLFERIKMTMEVFIIAVIIAMVVFMTVLMVIPMKEILKVLG